MIPLGILGAATPRPTGGGGDPGAAAILAKLTSWWEMDEASGNRADSIGSNHLAPNGTVSTAAGSRGSDVAASFAGAGSLGKSSTSSLQVPTAPATHCVFGWAYFNTNTGNQTIVSKWDVSSSAGLEYHIDNIAGSMRGINGASSYYTASASAPSAAAWHFYVLWRDPADGLVRLQIDDGTIYVSSSATNPAQTTSSLFFGSAGHTVNFLRGRVQRWGWIKGAILDPTERTYLYNSGTGKTLAEIIADA